MSSARRTTVRTGRPPSAARAARPSPARCRPWRSRPSCCRSASAAPPGRSRSRSPRPRRRTSGPTTARRPCASPARRARARTRSRPCSRRRQDGRPRRAGPVEELRGRDRVGRALRHPPAAARGSVAPGTPVRRPGPGSWGDGDHAVLRGGAREVLGPRARGVRVACGKTKTTSPFGAADGSAYSPQACSPATATSRRWTAPGSPVQRTVLVVGAAPAGAASTAAVRRAARTARTARLRGTGAAYPARPHGTRPARSACSPSPVDSR